MSKWERASRNSGLWLQKAEVGTKNMIEELVSAQELKKQQPKPYIQSYPVKKWAALMLVKPWCLRESQPRPAILKGYLCMGGGVSKLLL